MQSTSQVLKRRSGASSGEIELTELVGERFEVLSPIREVAVLVHAREVLLFVEQRKEVVHQLTEPGVPGRPGKQN